MYNEFFLNNDMQNNEKLSEKRLNNIKASVLARVKTEQEGKPMKKLKIKPLFIAAAIVGTLAAGGVAANAATGGALVRFFSVPADGGKKQIEISVSKYEEDGRHHELIEFEGENLPREGGVIIYRDEEGEFVAESAEGKAKFNYFDLEIPIEITEFVVLGDENGNVRYIETPLDDFDVNMVGERDFCHGFKITDMQINDKGYFQYRTNGFGRPIPNYYYLKSPKRVEWYQTDGPRADLEKKVWKYTGYYAYPVDEENTEMLIGVSYEGTPGLGSIDMAY